MTILSIPDVMTVAIRKRAFSVDPGSWPQASLEKAFAYGVQQLLNDAVAPAKDASEIEPLFLKRLDNLRAGVLRAATIRVGDPVEREARDIAKSMIEKALKAAGAKKVEGGMAAAISKLLAGPKGPTIRATAKANVALIADLGDVDVDDLDIASDEDESEEDDESEDE